MQARQRLYRLNLDDDLAFDKQIEPETGFEGHAFVDNWKSDLASRSDAAQLKLTNQTILVDGLQQARAQGPVNLQAGVDNDARELINLPRNPLVRLAIFVPLVIQNYRPTAARSDRA